MTSGHFCKAQFKTNVLWQDQSLKIQDTTPVWIWCVKYVTESYSHQSLLCGLGSGQLSLSDVMALRPPFTHGKKWSWSLRWGEEREEKKNCLNKKANAHWHFSGERGGCGCVMYLLSQCWLPLQTWCTRIGELKGKKPLNFHTICLVDLRITSNGVIYSSRSLKVAARLSKANCLCAWKVACWWCLNTECWQLSKPIYI